jgi:ATP-dependent Clp protease protease subunit
MNKDFEKFATSMGISNHVLDDVKKHVGKTFAVPNSSLTPVVMEERELRCTAVDVFSRLLLDRKIFFGNEFNTEACNIVMAELLYLSSTSDEEIQIMINSPGGSVVDGLGVIDTMSLIKCPVSTICMGMAASMGAVLLASGAEGRRFVLPHSRVMIHQPSTSFRGKFTDMEIELAQTARCKKDLYEILSKRMNKPFEEIEALCKDDKWFIGKEAVEIGIADKIIEK